MAFIYLGLGLFLILFLNNSGRVILQNACLDFIFMKGGGGGADMLLQTTVIEYGGIIYILNGVFVDL